MKRWIIGNWKMNGTQSTVRPLLQALLNVSVPPDVEIAVCPPFTLLATTASQIKNSALRLGAQDCSPEQQGAFTGDISADMLADAGCSLVILGHSERRYGHGETDELINRKIKAASKAGLKIILCVGETLAEREAGNAERVVMRQLERSMPGKMDAASLIIAYEPVWAIGTGKTATGEDITSMHASIHSGVKGVPVLYGGSVKSGNAKEILSLPGVDGTLVGGASLKAEEFSAIIAAARL